MMRLCVISHAMVHDTLRGRWQLLAERFPVEVDLVVPARWESTWFGGLNVWEPFAEQQGRFRVLPLPATDRRQWGRYLLRGLGRVLGERRPDVILVYGEEFSLVLHQTITLRTWRCPHAKLGFFTWNNMGIITGRKRWLKRLFWRRVRRCTDVALAGNREGADLLRVAGYHKPITVQTEIGVDTSLFRADETARARTRAELRLSGFVVGFAGRLTEAKGLWDLFAALEQMPQTPWTLLAVGDGNLRPALERHARERSWKAVFVGHVETKAMPDYMRAMDCMVLPSRTTPAWKEQFGLVLAQAMACGVPVVGSDSGAIPEVIGNAGCIVAEGDSVALARVLRNLADEPEERERLAGMGRDRAVGCYGAEALAAVTYELLALFTEGPMPAKPVDS